MPLPTAPVRYSSKVGQHERWNGQQGGSRSQLPHVEPDVSNDRRRREERNEVPE